jgi:hypothetical protein
MGDVDLTNDVVLAEEESDEDEKVAKVGEEEKNQ